MPDKSETGQTGGEDVKEQAKSEINERIEKAKTEEEKEELGKKLTKELETAIEEAEKAKKAKDEKKEEAFIRRKEDQVTIKMIQVFEAVRQEIPVAKTPQAKAFLEKVVEKIPSPTTSECSQLAAYLTPYLLGKKEISISPSGQPKSEFQEAFEALASVNPELAKKVKQALLEAVRDKGIEGLTQEMIENNLLLKETSMEKNRHQIPHELLDFYSQSDPETFRLLVAIQSKESFLEYLQEVEGRIKKGEIEIVDNDIDKTLSKYLEERFVDLIDQLYYKFDLNPSYITEEFGHVESKGFLKSILTAATILNNQIEGLLKAVLNDPNLKDKLGFYIRYTVTEERVERKSEGDEGKPALYLAVKTHGKKVNLGDFLGFVLNEMAHVREIREFTHNSRLLFRQGSAGKEGFWAQMAGYASRMKSTDFDSIAYLPHNDVFQEALMIYNQLLQAELAKFDWILNPKMFARKENGFTEIEERTLKIIQDKYKGEKTDLQIRAALSRAIGVSLGVLLTEVETIADADPGLKVGSETVEPTYVGEWLSDTVATTALNPFIKGILRWMAEGVTGGPMAYLQIPDPKKVKGTQIGIWDHSEAFRQIENFHQSFVRGERTTRRPGYKTLLDIRNPGRIGSIITRGGWRQFYSYDYYLELTENKKGQRHYDFYRTWRRIENIGFEPLVDFVSNRMGDFISGKVDHDQRMELIRYLLKSYFNDFCSEDDLKNIRSESEFFEKWRRKYGGKKPDEIRRNFLFQTLSRVLLYRLPSKLITHDRSRWSEDGKRMWERLRVSVFGQDDESFGLMDQALKDLILAQSTLRANLSDELGKIQREDGDIGETEITYLLSEDNIKDLLEKAGIKDQERIINAQKLFKKLREFYLKEGEIVSLSEKLKKYRDNFPFALAAEEIDYRFLVLRSTGETTIKRALSDMATVEQNVAQAYQQLIGLWHKVAISGKKDFSEIVSLLAKVKTTLTGFHGKNYANEITFYLAYLTIQYFKKDTFAKPLGGLAGIGTTNSIAGEFAGGSRRVWEWDSRDIGRFIYALEVAGVLEKTPYDLSKTPTYEPLHFSILGREVKLPEEINLSRWLGKIIGKKSEDGEVIPIRFFGKELKITMPKMQKKDFEIYSATLKQLAGGALIHKLYDAFNTVIPIGLAVLLIFLISQAAKEAFSDKK